MNRRDAIKAVMAMPAVARIAVADVKADDVIVFECDKPISDEGVRRLLEAAVKVWPGRKIVVLEEGLRMKIVPGSAI